MLINVFNALEKTDSERKPQIFCSNFDGPSLQQFQWHKTNFLFAVSKLAERYIWQLISEDYIYWHWHCKSGLCFGHKGLGIDD